MSLACRFERPKCKSKTRPSYEYVPNYDRAEALYRQALAIPDLEDRGDVQDRLDDLYDERAHPEKREEIKQARLRHIQRRKSRNETP